ncbi:MAG TPA: efflux RND transporter periplasmic adaptor subunit [Gemmatimonadales bacterium]|nr:efflux RND transporter periplasmic adaptor subunit [Gemmatimonadales bacterium]
MTLRIGVLLAAGLGLAACGKTPPSERREATAPPAGRVLVVRDTAIAATFDAVGSAVAMQRATLSTRLMGSVTSVAVQEGDRVRAGEVLARLDAREIASKREQVEAGIAAAEAVYRDAETQATRFRALYADSAATRYQLEQVETGLARAQSGLTSAKAARAELDAVGSYAEVRASFAGVVTHRFVDPGSFAAPGAPLLEIQDPSRLRVTVSVPAGMAARLKPGMVLEATIEGQPAQAVVEGVVPSGAGTVYTLNALIDNRRNAWLPGSAATLSVPQGTRQALLLPESALVHEGDLVGVRVIRSGAPELRWIRTGSVNNGQVEILSGVAAGDSVLAGEN